MIKQKVGLDDFQTRLVGEEFYVEANCGSKVLDNTDFINKLVQIDEDLCHKTLRDEEYEYILIYESVRWPGVFTVFFIDIDGDIEGEYKVVID